MRGVPHFQDQFRAPQNNPAQQQRAPQNAMQHQQMRHDEKLAQALQAQEYHRARHPSQIGGGQGGGHGGGHGGGGGLNGALGAMLGGGHGGGHSGGAPRDPEREARHKARDAQLEMALEVNPEAFVSVPMLYVNCLLNNTPIKAFVDTGAQMTVRGPSRARSRRQPPAARYYITGLTTCRPSARRFSGDDAGLREAV